MSKSVRILVATGVLFAAACQKSEQPTPARTDNTAAAATSTQAQAAATPTAAPSGQTQALTVVSDPSQVCMVTNQFMGKPQIPIAVDGRTYFGCCEMCKGRLGSDPSSRTALDPVSQRPVDKAVAVIGRNEDGAIFYFENEQNLAAYAR